MRDEPADDILAVQRYYPRIYHACHVRHVRAPSSEYGISGHDSMVLGHLDRERPVSPGRLARHLGVAASTLSATLATLEELGYLERRRAPGDRRHVELRLTAAGTEALAGTSVLDGRLVGRMLAQLAPVDRRRALRGLQLLAEAATAAHAAEGGES